MKKSVFLLLFFTSVLLGTATLVPNIEQKTFTSTKFETKIELGKEYQFVKIIDIPESKLTAVNCYGQRLEKWEWYIHSRNAGTFCPVNNDYYLSDYENADAIGLYSAFKATGQVKSDTIDMFCSSYNKDGTAYQKKIRVKILCFGKRIIKAGFNGQDLTYWVVEPKERNEKTEE